MGIGTEVQKFKEIVRQGISLLVTVPPISTADEFTLPDAIKQVAIDLKDVGFDTGLVEGMLDDAHAKYRLHLQAKKYTKDGYVRDDVEF